jgi:hypothetical protein
MAYATAAQRVLQKIHPQLALFHDRVYTPEGELFDSCWANGIDVIKWHPAHKSNTMMLKRYTLANREDHPISLSVGSWKLIREMKWTEAHREELHRELYNNYASGDWYSEAGTQFNRRLMGLDEIRRKIGLDLSKKTAFIFPHISWDASFIWGTSLFRNYEEWLVETVRAACANDQVNWVIKIHPAHVGKSVQEGTHWEPAEVTVLCKYIGPLPPHVFMIPADTEINTFSLFGLMDYCLTVRGTVGIEAASLGIPVLTAGTGRYDNKGFTIDSESREQYLERVAHIKEIPRLSPEQQELAERLAYGLFVLRPLPMKAVTFQYTDQEPSRVSYIKVNTQINIKTKEDWKSASDLQAFANWVTDPSQLDFLVSLPEI